jgi:hypothetical protein
VLSVYQLDDALDELLPSGHALWRLAQAALQALIAVDGFDDESVI